jgi:hypothetical protein
MKESRSYQSGLRSFGIGSALLLIESARFLRRTGSTPSDQVRGQASPETAAVVFAFGLVFNAQVFNPMMRCTNMRPKK